jgi:uncharacterized protein YyaL (SSP411 family)
MLTAIANAASRYPTAFGNWLIALDFALGPVYEVALVGSPDQLRPFQNALWSRYRPRFVVGAAAYPPPPGSPALLDDRPLLDKAATAYVCQGFVCQRPVNTPEDLLAQLEASSPGSQAA